MIQLVKMDMDGFRVNKKFICKELSYIETSGNKPISYRFKVGDFCELSKDDKEQACFCRDRIHGLQFEDYDSDLEQYEVEEIKFSLSLRGETFSQLIASKDGLDELDVFRKLNIANYFNLEDLKCPKFEVLVSQNKTLKMDCGFHSELLNKKVVHCPMYEVLCFNKWYNNYML